MKIFTPVKLNRIEDSESVSLRHFATREEALNTLREAAEDDIEDLKRNELINGLDDIRVGFDYGPDYDELDEETGQGRHCPNNRGYLDGVEGIKFNSSPQISPSFAVGRLRSK